MTQMAFILGGTGQIGRATAQRFAAAGWTVTVGGRDAAHVPAELTALGVSFAQVDRREAGSLEAALGEGADVLLDVIPFTQEDAEQLRGLVGRLGSVIAISSASVYADAEGRTIDEAKDEESSPRMPVPISETQPTVAPGDATYSTRKVAMEQTLLADDRLRATIVRPCAIHGPGGGQREWVFVKRALDRRPVVVLARRGATRFHTTSVANLAELIWLAAARPGRRVVNCGDPDAPSALEIARAVAAALEHDWTEVLLPGPEQGKVGDHPWNGPHPFVLDMLTAELELRYRPVTTYQRAVRDTVEWLVEATRERPWEEVLGSWADDYIAPLLDYSGEDTFLATLAGTQ
jgi:nucleoside-diphosphate-sugar epimerase